MNQITEVRKGPYKFTENDLQPDKLRVGVEHTLSDFYRWRDANPELVANHVEQHTELLKVLVEDYSYSSRLKRYLFKESREAYRVDRLKREIGFFCINNFGEIPKEETVEKIRQSVDSVQGSETFRDVRKQKTKDIDYILKTLEASLFGEEAPELDWLKEQLDHLHRILPESVVEGGGMGKAVRTLAGVLAIGVIETIDKDSPDKKQHLANLIPAAYAYGALYPIIDDTLQDSDYISQSDKDRYHQVMLKGLTTGSQIDPKELPDHPLAEELLKAYNIFIKSYPFEEHRHLYMASEAMYIAQDLDSKRTPESVAVKGLISMYPDIFIKASMSRVVANVLARNQLDSDFYSRSVNINFLNQLRDDMTDREEDSLAGRLTPFTYSRSSADTNPLYDLFAYSAYVAYEVFDNHPGASELLAQFSATRIATHLIANPQNAINLQRDYDTTQEIDDFILYASSLPARMGAALRRSDTRFEKKVNDIFKDRPQTNVDPRTFVSDRLNYINDVIAKKVNNNQAGGLGEIIEYALDAGGKRLRPALSLMLAEGLGVDYRSIEPLITAVELLHTSSLIFDDLPAQDNSNYRRGKPTAHIAFNEARAQLAGVSMISSGFGLLGELGKHYPAPVVNKVVEYFGSVLGPERLCRGQDIDLQMENGGLESTGEDIIEMYNLKTSTMIEAALTPIMMLAERSNEELELIRKYSYHSGIVFQIRDDILDAISDIDELGKDIQNDLGKINVVRVYGIEQANSQMQHHLNEALEACRLLPFNTNLLQGIVGYFATRRK